MKRGTVDLLLGMDRAPGARAISRAAPPPSRFILAIVIACEKNLTRRGLAPLLDCAHLQ
jgi:hypothetical protein